MRQEMGGISVRSSLAGRTINWTRSRCASLRSASFTNRSWHVSRPKRIK